MERVTCPVCGREVPAYTPRGGDGSGLMLRKHFGLVRGVECKWSRKMVVWMRTEGWMRDL